MKETENLWTGLGLAAVILAVFLGFGGCVKLVREAEKQTPTQTQSPQ